VRTEPSKAKPEPGLSGQAGLYPPLDMKWPSDTASLEYEEYDYLKGSIKRENDFVGCIPPYIHTCIWTLT
jgi:hypothetical protein